MRFQVVARDNHAGTGGINTADAFVAVDGNSGPFAVTSPNGGESLAGGNLANITWDVANYEQSSGIGRHGQYSDVNRRGNTFPATLASGAPNNGSAFVIIPSGLTTTARVKIAAVGNIFLIFQMVISPWSRVAAHRARSRRPHRSRRRPRPQCRLRRACLTIRPRRVQVRLLRAAPILATTVMTVQRSSIYRFRSTSMARQRQSRMPDRTLRCN
jgi:hypothetical protein